MKVGDSVKIKGQKQLYMIIEKSGIYFKLDPKPKKFCCNFFTKSELVKA